MGATDSRPGPELDGHSVTKPLGALDHDLLADLEPPLDRHVVTVRHPDTDRAGRDRSVGPHYVDERPSRTLLDGRGRHHRRAAPGLDEKAGVDELAGEQAVVGVRELRLEADRAGGRV